MQDGQFWDVLGGVFFFKICFQTASWAVHSAWQALNVAGSWLLRWEAQWLVQQPSEKNPWWAWRSWRFRIEKKSAFQQNFELCRLCSKFQSYLGWELHMAVAVLLVVTQVKTLISTVMSFLFLWSIRSFSDAWVDHLSPGDERVNRIGHLIESSWQLHVSGHAFRFGVLARCWNSSSCRCWWCMPPFPPQTRRSLEKKIGHPEFSLSRCM